MAATIRLTELNLGTGITHIATDYQIATDKLFPTGSIVVESLDNSVNLTQIMFDIALDPTIKYYGRIRVRLSTGYTAWGNVDIITPTDINNIALDIAIPSSISSPVITLTDPIDKFPLTGFTIGVSGFSSVGTSVHTHTSYSIEDINGTVIWRQDKDGVNINSIHVNGIVLDKNSAYRIKAMFHSSSNDVSQVTTTTVVTENNKFINLTTNINITDVTIDNIFNIVPVSGLTSTTFSLYNVINGETNSVILDTVNPNPLNIVIPIGSLAINNIYLLVISSNLETDKKYIPFSTYM